MLGKSTFDQTFDQDIVRITEENKSFLRQRLLVLSCAHRLLNQRCQMLTGSSVLKITRKMLPTPVFAWIKLFAP